MDCDYLVIEVVMKKIILSVASLLTFSSIWACSEHASSEHGRSQKVEKCEKLDCVRTHIDKINNEIILILKKRMEFVNQAGEIKKRNNIKTAFDKNRAEYVINQAEKLGIENGLPEGFARDVFQVIVDKSAHFEQKNMDTKVSENN